MGVNWKVYQPSGFLLNVAVTDSTILSCMAYHLVVFLLRFFGAPVELLSSENVLLFSSDDTLCKFLAFFRHIVTGPVIRRSLEQSQRDGYLKNDLIRMI